MIKNYEFKRFLSDTKTTCNCNSSVTEYSHSSHETNILYVHVKVYYKEDSFTYDLNITILSCLAWFTRFIDIGLS